MVLAKHEDNVRQFTRLILHAAGPALPRPHLRDTLRAAAGVVLGLAFVDLVLWCLTLLTGAPDAGFLTHPLLIAPLGASAVLIFATPASPLAQPWSVVVGNGLAAACAVAILHAGLAPLPALALAAFLAVAGMTLARALHPPGGAVAVATVLAASAEHMPGLYYVVVTVVLGSAVLVVFGVLYHRAMARSYPFRAAAAASAPPAPPERRLAPTPLVLAAALDRLRLGAILGVDDLAQLIETAEETSVSQSVGLTAGEIMTADLVIAKPEADWRALSALFVQHGFRSLPVVDAQGLFLGLISVQSILRPGAQGLVARHLAEAMTGVPPEARLADLLPPLAQGHQPALPVVDAQGRLAGIITRSDIVAALVHAMSHI